jgi:hypothetical protein
MSFPDPNLPAVEVIATGRFEAKAATHIPD